MTLPWKPISDAPKDGSFIVATGYNWGDPESDRHYVTARWRDFGKQKHESHDRFGWSQESTHHKLKHPTLLFLRYLTHFILPEEAGQYCVEGGQIISEMSSPEESSDG
jgi:hypothetical protein